MTWIVKAAVGPLASIDKTQSYVKIAGRKVDPGTYEVKYGEQIEVNIVAKNVGDWPGNLYIGVYDTMGKSFIWYTTKPNVPPGGSIVAGKVLTITRDIAIMLKAGFIEGGTMYTTSTWGCP